MRYGTAQSCLEIEFNDSLLNSFKHQKHIEDLMDQDFNQIRAESLQAAHHTWVEHPRTLALVRSMNFGNSSQHLEKQPDPGSMLGDAGGKRVQLK